MNVAKPALGIRWRCRKSLVKAFEPSRRAALRDGPKQRRPAAAKRSTIPETKGPSGPMMVSSISFSTATASSASMSSAAISRLLTFDSSAVPALPGATKTCCTRGDCAHFHASACSRPPPPTIRIFMLGALVAEMAHSGEHHGDAVLVGCRNHLGVTARAAGLDDRCDTEFGKHVQAVPEREKCVGGNGSRLQTQVRIAGLHGGDLAADDAAHLAGAYP